MPQLRQATPGRRVPPVLSHVGLPVSRDIIQAEREYMSMSYKWLPFGEFEVTDDAIVFSGEIVDVTKTDQSSEKQARVGRTISDQKCYGGKINVDPTFNYQLTNDPTSYPTNLEVPFFEAGSFQQIQVAGTFRPFSLFSLPPHAKPHHTLPH